MKTKPQSKTENDPLWSERRILDDLDVTASTLDRWRKDPVVRFPTPTAKVRGRNFTRQSIYLAAKERLFGKPERPRVNRARLAEQDQQSA